MIRPEPQSGYAGLVAVAGLPASALETLRELEPEVTEWQAVLSVLTEDAGPEGPKVLGKYEVAEGELRFRPRFPLDAGLMYRIYFDGDAFDELARSRRRTRSLRTEVWLGSPAGLPETTVSTVYPSTPTVPENLLRLYVEFSAPMLPQDVSRHVELVDSAGRRVNTAFVEIKEGLWDPGRTRLTLFLHPGRIKRGVGPNQRMGPPLRSGETYRLVIGKQLRDARGIPLLAAHQKSLRVGPPDRLSPEPSNWTLWPPATPSDPLRIELPEPLDKALLLRLVSVVASDGTLVPGRVDLSEGETHWSFAPDAPWADGAHRVRIDPALEDLAGNRIGRLFDEAAGAESDETAEPPVVELEFLVAENAPGSTGD